MKTGKIDFDYIGGQGSLTKSEEKELNDFFKSKKMAEKNSKQVDTIRKSIVSK